MFATFNLYLRGKQDIVKWNKCVHDGTLMTKNFFLKILNDNLFAFIKNRGVSNYGT